ncbi:MAG TPA: hypothetical protein PKD53_02105 [Chloroflexaceae bacterium]|nr:hypothetical protein [Chloroflexaceae bacterium]
MKFRPLRHAADALWEALGRALLALVGLLALLGGSLALAAPTAQQQQPQAAYAVYLPMVRGGGARSPNQPGPAPSPSPSPAPPTQRGARFLEPQIKHASADVALDSAGGMHAAYAHFIPSAENPRAVYTFCKAGPSGCAGASAWQSVALGERVREVQLELTATGAPRLLIVSDDPDRGGLEHHYAACDQGCASAGAWTSTLVVTSYNASEITEQDQPQRSFALDPQGRPAFLYNDRNYQYAEPDLYGAFYASCAARCTEAGSWSTTGLSRIHRGYLTFDYEKLNYQALRFTPDGEARFVARVYALNEDGSNAENGLYYYGCDAGCADETNWRRRFLVPTGGGAVPHPSWDLAFDGAGRPRVALFLGDSITPADFVNQLLYIACDAADCLAPGDTWSFSQVLKVKGAGQGADVEVDRQGRPRIAWIDPSGDLGYAWCDAACASDTATWRQQIVEREAQLREANPQAIPGHCRNDLWNGLAPALALDGAGNPRIAYDVAVSADCYYDTTPGDPSDPPTVRFEPIWRGVRLTYFPQP